MNSLLCDSNFNLFGFLVATIAFSMSLRRMLFIKLKTACFKTNICFENEKNQCVYTSQESNGQWEHFYQYQITTWAFHHNRVCKLQSQRLPVVLLIKRIAYILQNSLSFL